MVELAETTTENIADTSASSVSKETKALHLHHYRKLVASYTMINIFVIFFEKYNTWLGACVLLCFGFYHFPAPTQEVWAETILLLAALVLLPLAGKVLDQHARHLAFPWYFPILLPFTSFCLSISFWMPPSTVAGIWAFPWLVTTFIIAFSAFLAFVKKVDFSPAHLALTFSQLFLPIGGLWTMASRMGVTLLGFKPAIVLLTGIHFHYAGFFFPLLCGLIALASDSPLAKWACRLAIISIPLTAIGITITQFTYSHSVESLSAIVVTISGFFCAFSYLKYIRTHPTSQHTKWSWLGLSFCLMASMSLAFLYAIRHTYWIEYLTIPHMRAWHGTLNSVGVAGLGLWGWRYIKTFS